MLAYSSSPMPRRALWSLCTPTCRSQMIREAAVRPATLTALMRDQFGNYVVQRCLDVAMPAQRQALLEAIQVHGCCQGGRGQSV